MSYLYERVGANRIEAGHDVGNPNSGNVMIKAGQSGHIKSDDTFWTLEGKTE